MVLTGRNTPIPRQAPWKYDKYSLRVFPCLDTFLRRKGALAGVFALVNRWYYILCLTRVHNYHILCFLFVPPKFTS